MHKPPSPSLHPSKRPRQSTPDKESPGPLSAAAALSLSGEAVADGAGGGAGQAGKSGQSSNFRNVSACNRCRLRKNRCDQKLPSCASCEKANVSCVGYDPITKREIPRSYVFYLEARVQQLENLLNSHNVSFPPADSLDYCSRPGNDLPSSIRSPTEAGLSSYSDAADDTRATESRIDGDIGKPHRLAPRPGPSDASEEPQSRHLGSVSGLSFARVVFAAVQSSMSDQKSTSDRAGVRPYRPPGGGGNGQMDAGTSMRDSFFGLHTRPTIHPATFPDRQLAEKLVKLYFEHANPQIPVLHREDFMAMFEQAYADKGRVRGPRELYMLNMVFAIGGGIIMGDASRTGNMSSALSPGDVRSKQCQPEEYHASAIVHLEACLSNNVGGLVELQAVLLQANFALLRPVPPGLWYIAGVATRLAVDLGLHYEDGKNLDSDPSDSGAQPGSQAHARECGRREYIRDLRRRLWWCTYTFDRLVSICVGRPFGISDQAITTEFPSLLDDRYIKRTGFLEPSPGVVEPTYKLVAHHYFRLRLLQSEILQVLQYEQAQVARANGQNQRNPYMHSRLPSPFLSKYDSFRSWRIDIDRRLYEWKTSAPTKEDTGVAFSTNFLELNYWQAIIMLYRQSLSVPAMFEGEYDTSKEVDSPTVHNVELREDEDRVYLKVAEAGQKIIRLYRQLHLDGLVNYTYLATHHIFIAGIAYLYAIWHSPIVRSRLSMEEVDFTVLAATSVLTPLTEKCPPAEACRDAFNRTAKATVKMANSTGGFGQPDPSSLSHGMLFPGRTRNGPPSGFGASDDTVPASGVSARHLHQPPGDYLSQQVRRQIYDHGSSSVPQRARREPTFATPLSSAWVKHQSSTASASPTATSQAVSDVDSLDPSPVSSIARRRGVALGSADLDMSSESQASALLSTSAQPPTAGSPSAPNLSGSTTPTTTAAAGGLTDFFAQDRRQQQQQQTPLDLGTAVNLGDLQDMEFLQGLRDNSSGGDDGVMDPDLGVGEAQMDYNFGLGWDGFHHDYSDGQLDLFDGFFFGDQRGSGGGGERG